MGFRINTNIAAMNSHNNAVKTNQGLDKSLASLSSGLRINTAADDASGMTIADSLRSQAQGLGQAINNANDGVAVVQTADGALDEYINIINSVRTKSIQAASDGQNADSRAAIQSDIDRLLQAADGIANQTQFNGQKLLDGSFTNKAFHVGAYAGETVSLSVDSVKTDSVGGVTSMVGAASRADFVTATDLSESATGYALAADALTVNGTDVSSSLNTLSPTSLTDASSVAAAITDATGLVTDASNTFTATGAIIGGSITADTMKINGVALAATEVTALDADGALVRAINDITDQTGVTASLDANKKLVLDSADGANISITNSTATTAVAQIDTFDVGDVSGNLTGDIFTVNYDSVDYTYTTLADGETAATIGDALATALAADAATTVVGGGDGSMTITADVAGTALATGTTLASGLEGGGTFTDSSSTLPTTLNVVEILQADASDYITGLTADHLTSKTSTAPVAALTSDNVSALVIAEGDLVINGVDMAGTYGDGSTAGGARAALETAVQAISGLEDSSIDALGNIELIANDGQDLNIAGVTATGTFKLDEGVTNESAAGKVEIFSKEAISLGGVAETSFGLTEGTTGVTDNGSSLESIDVTDRNSAEVAILIADSALKQLDSTRSDLGSVQNQLESTIRNISVTQVNVTSAESQIRDVDFASESANFAKLNILAQSGSYAMSQANAVQQNVMRLLQ